MLYFKYLIDADAGAAEPTGKALSDSTQVRSGRARRGVGQGEAMPCRRPGAPAKCQDKGIGKGMGSDPCRHTWAAFDRGIAQRGPFTTRKDRGRVMTMREDTKKQMREEGKRRTKNRQRPIRLASRGLADFWVFAFSSHSWRGVVSINFGGPFQPEPVVIHVQMSVARVPDVPSQGTGRLTRGPKETPSQRMVLRYPLGWGKALLFVQGLGCLGTLVQLGSLNDTSSATGKEKRAPLQPGFRS